MMESFGTFFEKRISNPLRKKELEGQPDNKQRLADELSRMELPPEEAQKLKNLQAANVDPEFIEKFKASKLAGVENELKHNLLRHSIKPDKYSKILSVQGMDVFQDNQNLTFDLSKDHAKLRILKHSINTMLNDLRGLVPIRKPRIIVTNTGKKLKGKSIYATGDDEIAPAYYMDRIIFIDVASIDEPYYFVHEYAHYTADLIPKQSGEILRKEYEGMLDNYFQSIKKKKRTSLEPQKLTPKDIAEAEMWRKRIAKKLGLPSEYSATNFDEFWAEIISNWKTMPNNKNTYRFKTIAKKIMTRLN